MKAKKFDCVEMMHKGSEQVRKRLEGMSLEQQLEYWRQRTEDLREMKREAQAKRKAS